MSTRLAPPSAGLTPPASRSEIGLENPAEDIIVRRKLQRAAHVLFRYKWLIMVVTIAGTAVGVLATRLLKPAYEVQGTIWIAGESSSLPNAGPIRAGELMTSNSWPDLLRSYAVLDTVTRNLRLFVSPANTEDASLFGVFDIESTVRPGRYVLHIDASDDRYALEDKDGRVLENGRLGDPIGRNAGFRWVP